MHLTDISVVGAGPVGMTLALALAKSGYKVTIVERQPFSENQEADSRRLVLSWGSVQLLKHIGLADPLHREGEPINDIAVRKAGSIISGHFHASQHKQDYFAIAIGFSTLISILRTAINHSSSITLTCPFNPKTITLAEESIVLGHDDQTISSRLAIAVDGTDSQMLSLLGIDNNKQYYGQMASMANVTLSESLNRTACEVFAGDYTFILIPDKGKQATLVQLSHMHSELSDRQVLNRAFLGMAPKIMSIKSTGFFSLVGTHATEILRPRCLIMGNAARTIHPLLAQGLNLAYKQTSLLIKTLAANKDPGNWQLLRSYQKQACQLDDKTACSVNLIRHLVDNDWPLSHLFCIMNMTYPLRDRIVSFASGDHKCSMTH